MEPARRLSSEIRCRQEAIYIEWEPCVFCQDPRTTSKTNPLRQATEDGINNITQGIHQREKYNDETFIEVIDTLTSFNLLYHAHEIRWHKACYSSFTQKGKIEWLKQRFKPEAVSDTNAFKFNFHYPANKDTAPIFSHYYGLVKMHLLPVQCPWKPTEPSRV